MAEHDLGHTEKSQQALEELSQLIAERRNASQQLNHNVLIAEILQKEAESKFKVNTKEPSGSETDPSSPSTNRPPAEQHDAANANPEDGD